MASSLTGMRRPDLWDKQAGLCFWCHEPMHYPGTALPIERWSAGKQATLDHVIPKSLGGGRGSNLVYACYQCNHRRGAAPLRDLGLYAGFAVSKEALLKASNHPARMAERIKDWPQIVPCSYSLRRNVGLLDGRTRILVKLPPFGSWGTFFVPHDEIVRYLEGQPLDG